MSLIAKKKKKKKFIYDAVENLQSLLLLHHLINI